MHFCEVLRNLLDERNMTQKQLSQELGIMQSTLGGYVQGTREPDFETLKLLARYFQVSTDYLLGFYGDQTVADEAEILRIFRTLSKDQQELYIEQGKAFIRVNQKNSAK